MDQSRFLIALGSNIGHPRHGPPRAVLNAALGALDRAGLAVEAASAVIESAPIGPSRRRYANAAAIVLGPPDPPALLTRLQQVERDFGRQRRGSRWQARTLDLDIILWAGGCWHDRALIVPHREFRMRDFVLGPAMAIAADWRDPITGLTLRHLHARLTRPASAPR